MTQNGDETRAMNKQIQSEVTLTPPLLDLPSHLIEEILFRLPVKSLLQLQCLCKELNSLISDIKFRKNHLRYCFSTNRFQVHSDTVSPLGYSINSYPVHSIFSSFDLSNATTNFECPLFNQDKPPFIVGSCDGILCIADYVTDLILMCNPSIRKFNQLPLPLEEENPQVLRKKAYGFGYDPLSHNYKVVVVKGNTRVKIHTLGTHSWRSIGDFPFEYPERVGVCLNGTVNWLATHKTNLDFPCVIVSLNLENESFQQVPQPNYGRRIKACFSSLSVQRDCLCLVADGDVWMMKEFGNQNSWTKLITIPYPIYASISYGIEKLLYICEDDKKLLYISEDNKLVRAAYGSGLHKKLVVCDSGNGLVKCKNTTCCRRRLHLSIESLISP